VVSSLVTPLGTVRDRPAYAWLIRIVRIVGLMTLAYITARAVPGAGRHGRSLAISLTLAVACLSWLYWVVRDGRTRRLAVPLTLLAMSGGLLAALTPNSPAIAFTAVATLGAAALLSPEATTGIAVSGALTMGVGALVVPDLSTSGLLGYLLVIAAGLSTGFIRLGYTQRAEQAEALLEQTRRAADAERETAALSERTRIAREIHDILAHSLGALSLQLEAADALLGQESVPQDNPAVVKARGCVDRASQLTRAGLVESRRAILALREDSTPLDEMLRKLTSSPEAEQHAFTIHGTPRQLPPDATIALFRTAQEAVSNARKHAPGQPVTLDLTFGEHEVRLLVVNDLPDAATPRPLTASGGGFGLTGLRERAELAGGTLKAGRVDTTWQVCATIPG
jgi:signal transduction histidine kinase